MNLHLTGRVAVELTIKHHMYIVVNETVIISILNKHNMFAYVVVRVHLVLFCLLASSLLVLPAHTPEDHCSPELQLSHEPGVQRKV